jgi:chromosomal replication initiation ATPase DnaA
MEILISVVYADAMQKHMLQVETLNQSQRPVYDLAAEATLTYFQWEHTNLYNSEADRCKQPEQLRILLQGGPGSGKTYLMTIIAERFRIESRRYDQMRVDTVGIAAPTAAAVIPCKAKKSNI